MRHKQYTCHGGLDALKQGATRAGEGVMPAFAPSGGVHQLAGTKSRREMAGCTKSGWYCEAGDEWGTAAGQTMVFRDECRADNGSSAARRAIAWSVPCFLKETVVISTCFLEHDLPEESAVDHVSPLFANSSIPYMMTNQGKPLPKAVFSRALTDEQLEPFRECFDQLSTEIGNLKTR